MVVAMRGLWDGGGHEEAMGGRQCNEGDLGG